MALFSYRGRIRRPAFVLWYCVAITVAYALFIVGLLLALGPCPASSSGAPSGVVLSLWIPAGVAVVWSTTFAARRLHDCGWSGWWAMVLVAVPAVSILALTTLDGNARSIVMSIVPLVVSPVEFGGLLLLALRNGAPAENRFGPPPKNSWSLRALPPQTT